MSREVAVDRDALAAVEAAVRGVAGVRDVAVLARPTAGADSALDSGRARGPATAPAPRAAPEPAPAPVSELREPAVVSGGELSPDDGFPRTMSEALFRAASQSPDKGYTYLIGDRENRQTYAELLADAQDLLGGLQASGLLPGASVLFQIEGQRAFTTALFACFLGGYIATPVGVSPDYSEDNAATRRLGNTWQLLERPLVLTDRAVASRLSGSDAPWRGGTPELAVVEDLVGSAKPGVPVPPDPDAAVLNLLTSGSTGMPKCVRMRNRQIVAGTRGAIAALGLSGEEVVLNWMPVDHAGGLVMFHLRSVFLRCDHVSATPDAFAADPLRWFDWADRYGATATWAANFAFNLVAARAAEAATRGWDLSRLRHVASAGEAVQIGTARRFLEALAPHGLPSDALQPCFGMTEAPVGVFYGRISRDDPETGTRTVDKRSLDGDLRPPVPGAEAVTLVDVGPPIPGVQARVVERDGNVAPAGRIGRLQLRGTAVLTGYHGDEAANRAAFTDGWFTTGDLAVIADGRVTVTGREKDIIIVRGRNYLNHDLESVVEQVPGTSPTWVAACGDADEDSGTEALIVFFVPDGDGDDSSDARTWARTAEAIGSRLSRQVGLRPDLVVPVPRHRFPKTRSGKLQRGQLLVDLRAGVFADRMRALSEVSEPLGRSGSGPADSFPAPVALEAGSFYVVTGGLDGPAPDIGGYLMAAYGLRILFLGGRCDERDVEERLARLALLGEAEYRTVDTADSAALAETVRLQQARWGRALDGVIDLGGAALEEVLRDQPGVTVVPGTALGTGADPDEAIYRLLRTLRSGQERIIVAYTASDAAAPAKVRAVAAAALGAHEAAVSLHRLDGLPRDADGRVAERRLWARIAAAGDRRGRQEYQAPQTGAERALAAIWAEVLDAGPVGRTDNFFELGGTSLLAAQLVDRVNRALGAGLAAHHLYRFPTISALAVQAWEGEAR